MSDSGSGDDSESDDYSLKSSYDAEVAYKYSPNDSKHAKLNHFHQDSIKQMERKETAKFTAPTIVAKAIDEMEQRTAEFNKPN